MEHPEWLNGLSSLIRTVEVLYALGIAACLYATVVSSAKPVSRILPSLLGWLIWCIQATVLGIRWTHLGLMQPPWTTPYEVLWFLSWAVLSAHLFFDGRHGRSLSFAGVPSLAIGLAGVLYAEVSLSPYPVWLDPAHQSSWYLLAKLTGLTGSAFLVYSFSFPLFRLVHTQLPSQAIMTWISAFCGLSLILARSRLLAFFPGAKVLLLSTASLLLVHAVLGLLDLWRRDPELPYRARWVGQPDEKVDAFRGIVRWLFIVSCLSWTGYLVTLISIIRRAGPLTGINGGILALGGLCISLMLVASFSVLKYRSVLDKAVASSLDLSRLTYRSVLAGYLPMGFSLLFAGIWSYYASGFYWEGSLAEVAELSIWLVATIYLHAFLGDHSSS